jgi:hypothetical protein
MPHLHASRRRREHECVFLRYARDSALFLGGGTGNAISEIYGGRFGITVGDRWVAFIRVSPDPTNRVASKSDPGIPEWNLVYLRH